MKEFFKSIWKYLLLLVIGIVIGICINIPSCKKLEPVIEYIPVHDTISIEKERIVEHTKIKYVTDTLLKLDSIIIDGKVIYDTIYASLPYEHKLYKDTIKSDSSQARLDIYYGGIYSSIDSIHIDYDYYKEREIIIQKPKRFGLDVTIGPYVGYGLTIDKEKQISSGAEVGIGISLGLSYRITK